MKNFKLAAIAACAMLALGTIATSVQAAEKQKKNVETKSQTARGATDPNIKSSELPANDPAQATASKPDASRGACRIAIDSRRNLYIKIFIDGEFRGVMSPNGDSVAYAYSGGTRLYARADFTDGSYTSWGPEHFYCEDGSSYTWTLR
jgi:hypothetical protein